MLQTDTMSAEESAKIKEEAMNIENQRQNLAANEDKKKKKKRPEAMTAMTWRDLIPVIKIEICSVSSPIDCFGKILEINRLKS